MICNSSSTWKTSKDLPNHSSCKKNHMQLLYFLEKARICSKSHLSLQKSLLILWVGCKNIFMCTLLGVVSVLLNMAFLSEYFPYKTEGHFHLPQKAFLICNVFKKKQTKNNKRVSSTEAFQNEQRHQSAQNT